MKVLASAYACDPRVGSEPGIGWNWARQIARHHDLVLVVRENDAERVRTAAQAEGLVRMTVVGYDLPRWMRFWKRGPRGALLYFYLWQLGLAPLARRLDAEHDFDVLHHLTFASSWMPSGLAFTGKPFVWGPVGRHPRVPDRFLRRGDWIGRVLEPSKACVRHALARLDPLRRATVRAADRVLSLSNAGVDAARKARTRTVPMLAAGTRIDSLAAPRRREEHEAVRVLFVGRLVDLKGVRLALEAFGRLARSRASTRLVVVGDGPLEGWLERRALGLGIADRVELRGHLGHEETLGEMERAHVFLFPSFEGAGMVVVEALARALPVVCLECGGPGEMVQEHTGIRVPVGGFDETVVALADALLALATDEERRLELARGALAWAGEHASWDAKGARLGEIYAGAVAHWRAA